ncbi:hypothetical protein ACSQ67_024693 [Phaseolus vulgaris]
MRKGHASKRGSLKRKSNTTRCKEGKNEGADTRTINVQRFLLVMDVLYSGLEVGTSDRSYTHCMNGARTKLEKGSKGLAFDDNGVVNIGSELYRL